MAALVNAVPTPSAAPSVAIIGAGLSGLACGHRLAQHGVSVQLFDKARGPGGRMSSKQRPAATLDLGAQAFTARDTRFAKKSLNGRPLAAWQHGQCTAIRLVHPAGKHIMMVRCVIAEPRE
ncbi:FAD-dependent oxidoreductase [Halomonas sp. LY9]